MGKNHSNKWYVAAAAAVVLLCSPAQSALVLYEDEAGNSNFNQRANFAPGEGGRMMSCEQQIQTVCAKQQVVQGNLLFGGIANKITCLAENQLLISDECFLKEMDASLEYITSKQDKKCRDQLRSKCGKQIDQFKRALQDTSVIGTIKGAVDVVECIVNHAEDLWEKCKPFTEGETGTDCSRKAVELCPREENDNVITLANSMGCLVQQAPYLGSDCIVEQVMETMEAMETSSDKNCRDELRKECGKQIDQLKKEIQDTSVIGILKGAVDVVQCVAQNARALWEKCKPFALEEEQADDCAERAVAFCPYAGNKVELLVANLGCLVDKSSSIGDSCAAKHVAVAMQSLELSSDKNCQDEMRKKCGKQIDELKKSIQNFDITGILKGASRMAECVVDNADDLWEKCKPFATEEKPALNLADPILDCSSKVAALCPPTEHKIMGLGFTLGCLAEQSGILGEECVKREMIAALDAMDNTDDKSCHDELRKKCGKQIDELKKQIQHTSVIGIVKGAVDVVQCVAQNAEDLWKKCNPFEEEGAEAAQEHLDAVDVAESDEITLDIHFAGGAPTPPTRRPTHKPTHKKTNSPTKKTKSPTKKPTHVPSAKPTNPGATDKPTVHKIKDALMGENNMDVVEQEFDDEEDDVETEEWINVEHVEIVAATSESTTIEYDMNACVRSARAYCARQVEAFNESPFDVSLMQNLNDCIERNAAAIEAECVVAKTSFISYFPSFENPMTMMKNTHHAPCRHPDDVTSNLPVCDPHHKCGRRHAHMFVGVLVGLLFFFTLGKVGRKMCARPRNADAVPHIAQPAGGAYVPLKSDDAAAVPIGSIV
jgi:uncharacterized membrane-anchored protein YjiN (DUF445 family)